MIPHLRYLKYVLLHKWYVFRAGRALGGIPLWRLLIHDYSKFSKAEWCPYVRRFFSGRSGKDPNEFKKAFEHHWKRNPHHWEYWVAQATNRALPMPEEYAREMVADWLAAGKGITGSWDLTEWYDKTKNRQIINFKTRALIESILNNRVKYPRGVIAHLENKADK